MKLFDEKKKKFGSIAALFNYVVNHKHRAYYAKSVSHRGRIAYQPERLGLQRRDFFPNTEDWEKFRTYAYLKRVSITFLFVMILMDWEGFERDEVGVPSIPEKIILFQSLTISEAMTYLEIHRIIL